MRTAIVLFTRDLRLHDNLTLSTAAREAEQIVPLFVFDDAILGTAFARPNRVAFLLDTLRDLDASLTRRGGHLVLRSGDVVAETLALAREVRAETVFVAEDASGYAQRRQRRLAEACHADRVALRLTPGVTVAPLVSIEASSGQHYRVFTPFYRAWSRAPRRPVEATPRRLPMPTGVSRGRLPTLSRLVPGRPSPELPPGGETAGRRRLSAWLRSGAAGHDDLAADATSRLSPYLHFGCISPLEVARRAAEVAGAAPFGRQLAWRDFFHQLLAARPETAHQDMRPRGDRWSDDTEALETWKQGKTGYPIVDACMRQLLREGYMHNRARLITASFLVHDLRVDWRAGARHLFDWLVDGDVANNVGNWQWVAGTGANPRPPRAFNPLRQAYRFDPDGVYVRRYVPELAAIEGRAVHEPWKLRENATGYPTPIVDRT
ncbi:MAG TPA: deoxyribodipyrimidine photo-lyase [Gaiellaceae bacterium]